MKKTIEERRDELLGKEYETNGSGRCFIIDYKGTKNILVMFYEPVCIVKCCMSPLNDGRIRNPMLPSVNGRGYLGIGKYSSVDKCVYKQWTDMLTRAYSERFHSYQHVYKDVTVCEEWWNFQNFAEWCYSQRFFKMKDSKGRSYQLDKDILVRGNKLYSPETCCFVPHEVNSLILKGEKVRGEYPVGVYYHKMAGKFQARYSSLGVSKYLGLFNTPEEAFEVYKQAKESYIKTVANKLKYSIDSKVYESLIKYEIYSDD